MNAVVSLGGCTASFVSPQWLVVTNHHCAMGAIQLNSTPQDNLIENGFIAADMTAERPAGPGTRIWVTTAFTPVTERVLAAARGKTGRDYLRCGRCGRKADRCRMRAGPGHAVAASPTCTTAASST